MIEKNTLEPVAEENAQPKNLPPAGTYPSQNEKASLPPEPAPAPASAPKTRRVGTITLALALIALGVILVLRVFAPSLDYVLIARLSPIVLVLLGIEILLANVFNKSGKLKYDFLSMFVCLLMLGGSLVAVVVPELIRVEIIGDRVSNHLSRESTDLGNLAFRERGVKYSNLEVYVDIRDTDFDADMPPEEISSRDYVWATVYFGQEYKNKEDFAKDVQKAVAALDGVVPHLDYGAFYSYHYGQDGRPGEEGAVRYSLYFGSRYQIQNSAQNLVELVEVEYWIEDGYYVGEWEFNDRREHPEQYGIYEEVQEGEADDSSVSRIQ